MTTPIDNNTASREAALRPLPALKVLRDAYCSQAAADEAISLLESQNPDLLLDLLDEEQERDSEYSNLALHALEAVAKSGTAATALATPLGKLDLVFELSRRLRKAYGIAELLPQGRPLAAGPDEPLPPLVALEVDETAERHGVTQNIADKVLQASYAARPDLWFVFAEEYRHGARLDASDALRVLLHELLFRDFPASDKIWASGDLYLEAVRRMQLMCGLEE